MVRKNASTWSAAALALAGTSYLAFLTRAPESPPPPVRETPALGDEENVRQAFSKWVAAHERAGGDRNVVLGLGWSKALSKEYTKAAGRVRLDLLDGAVSVEARNLPEGVSEVWLVDNVDRPGDSCAPEVGDAFIRVGSLVREGEVARLEADLGDDAFAKFDVDVALVAREGKGPVSGGVLFGSPTFFQRFYRQATRAGQNPSLAMLEHPARSIGVRDPMLALLAPLQITQSPPSLVEVGSDLFFNEQFMGNGRTCGTCHPANNSLTIDPTFIATLPQSNALFVAENNPDLAQNFENPVLMRQVGLILENVDGFGDLDNVFAMRGVPHTLALGTSITGVPGAQGGADDPPPNQNTGWSGDGAPNEGTLRDFATGAVTQHFPKTLNRVPHNPLTTTVNTPADFRLPNDAELDAMEVFQLSLGRQAEINLAAMSFKNAVVERGKRIFNNSAGSGLEGLIPPDPDPTVAAGKCLFCHKNAGAQDLVLEVIGVGAGLNANFDTGVEDLPAQPADLLVPPNENPPDGGFGQDPDPTDGFGDNTFATPPLIEAADTGPFFHNNAIETIEEAVNFYNSDAFAATSISGGIGGIDLEPTEVVAVAAMLRVLNALENINEAVTSEQKALAASNLNKAKPHILQAREEILDAIEVLRCGKLHPKAVGNLVSAASLLQTASTTSNNNSRNALINQAIAQQNLAKNDMIN